jgi:hypothetical protein
VDWDNFLGTFIIYELLLVIITYSSTSDTIEIYSSYTILITGILLKFYLYSLLPSSSSSSSSTTTTTSSSSAAAAVSTTLTSPGI